MKITRKSRGQTEHGECRVLFGFCVHIPHNPGHSSVALTSSSLRHLFPAFFEFLKSSFTRPNKPFNWLTFQFFSPGNNMELKIIKVIKFQDSRTFCHAGTDTSRHICLHHIR